MKKALTAVVLAMGAALVLCMMGCSNNSSSTNAPNTESSSTESASASESAAVEENASETPVSSNADEQSKELDWDALSQEYSDDASKAKDEWSMEKVICTATVFDIHARNDGTAVALCNIDNTGSAPIKALQIILLSSDANKVHKSDDITVEGVLSFDSSSDTCFISDAALTKVNGKDVK